ncbi:MAG: dTMP kinase [Candidatus Puniceispirillum sp.]|nr:dTMP kinase [Candidatus Puniceispirillum sp.]
MTQRGRFITFEGGEGSGKSTQIRALADLLTHHGIPCLHTREPGGSVGAEKIRALIVRGKTCDWDVMSEYLLLSAARRDHVVRTIRPALESGTWVVCDRYMDSSRVYQGLRGLDRAFMEEVYAQISQSLEPDLTFVLDVDPRVGLTRAAARQDAENRFEKMGSAFHAQVREAFQDLARENPARCVLINADQDVRALTKIIMAEIEGRFLQQRDAPCPSTHA